MITYARLNQDDDIVVIALPDGKEIKVQLSDLDSDSLPEICILLPQPMVANCWMPELTPSVPIDKDTPYALELTEIHIPVENAMFGAKYEADATPTPEDA